MNVDLDPLVGLTDSRTPLRSQLLSVPELKARYLEHVKTIGDQWLDWKKLGPVVAHHRELIEKAIEADTRKLFSFNDFKTATADTEAPAATPGGGRPVMSVRSFADLRKAFLNNYFEKMGEQK